MHSGSKADLAWIRLLRLLLAVMARVESGNHCNSFDFEIKSNERQIDLQHWVLLDSALCSTVSPLEHSTGYARQPRFTGRGGDGCVREYGVYPLSEIALDFQMLQEHYPLHKVFENRYCFRAEKSKSW